MLGIFPDLGNRPLRVLAIGAHSDDLEIGCAGTLLEWLAAGKSIELDWAVASAQGQRADEAGHSVRALFGRRQRVRLHLAAFRDGHFPAQFTELKARVAGLIPARAPTPDLVLCHRLEDRHQDHRLLAELAWQTFRDHLMLEYEIPKFEGDLGQPNVFVPLRTAVARRKVTHLMQVFGSQRGRHWFDERTFDGLMRLRGIECRAPSGLAEAFYARKLLLAPPPRRSGNKEGKR